MDDQVKTDLARMQNVAKTELLISRFKPFISGLNGNNGNIVIGGTAALVLHGLELHREVDDLDVIIYAATKKQKRTLELLSAFDYTVYYGTEQKTLKLKDPSGLELNIILEKSGTPNQLLSFEGVLIQSVAGVVAAKRGYTITSGSGVAYSRRKDVLDLQALKQCNFNYE